MTVDVAAAGAGDAPAPSRVAKTSDAGRILLAGAEVVLRPSGALHWPDEALLCVGDLHLGRAERSARAGSTLLPPYETTETLERLAAEIAALAPRHVVCLGDSFDDLAAAEGLADEAVVRIDGLAAGRNWIWIAGNHDPGPVTLPGTHRHALSLGPFEFRHAARPARPAGGEVSAHLHPKARLTRRGVTVTRRCFLADSRRLILPAFGTYTGGLDARDAAYDGLLERGARAYLLGRTLSAVPRERLDA